MSISPNRHTAVGETVARVALDVPLRKTFDFLVPGDMGDLEAGIRVEVPFGRRKLVGVVMGLAATSELPMSRLRGVIRALDREPLYPPAMLGWLDWIAGYYHHPIGEVLFTALPALLRRGAEVDTRPPPRYTTTDAGAAFPLDGLKNAPVQRRALDLLQTSDAALPMDRLKLECGDSWRRVLNVLVDKGLVKTVPGDTDDAAVVYPATPGPTLNESQAAACRAIEQSLGAYRCFTLFGITGSGKTEVYLRVIEAVLKRGGQALMLIPEIGLTPQFIARFRERLDATLVVMHSGLSDAERHRAWAWARAGRAGVVLGTRSAIFTPLRAPGIIIIDEEHDLSYKQQDGLRYNTRDIAIYRATLENLPIVLGSATPSFETLANIKSKRYGLLRLEQRASGAALPAVGYVDLRRVPVQHGLSRPLLDAMQLRLDRGEQSLIFINRRGFAPVLFCIACSWQARCQRCDAKLIYHRQQRALRCHHCGYHAAAPVVCPDCGADPLMPLGQGTQRIEEVLQELFPDARILRFDRDSMRRKGELQDKLDQVGTGEADILVGTQLLTKGHHFPGVTLVGVIDADQGLYSVDFRATEHLFQQIVQVAGRAGRADRPGAVLIQTVHPDHPHFEWLARHDYAGFAEVAMQERNAAQCPPFSYFALLRAESTKPGAGLNFLKIARAIALTLAAGGASTVLDPVPAPMEKRAGRFRAQLLLTSPNRGALHKLLHPWIERLENHPEARRVRWSIDVDPMEMY